ncbi:MAG TPA: hypothetical protein PK685_01735 [archaeon]|nr:hypothetical protein [archaeon]
MNIKINRQRYRKYQNKKEQITAVIFLFLVMLLFLSKNIDFRTIVLNNQKTDNSVNNSSDRFEKAKIVNDSITINELQIDDTIYFDEITEDNYIFESLNILEDEIEEISPR